MISLFKTVVNRIFSPVAPDSEKGCRSTKQQLQIPVCRSGIPSLLFHLPACGQWDSNPHGCPLAPKTNASANSAMTAHRSGSRLFRLPKISLSYNSIIIPSFWNFCQGFYGILWRRFRTIHPCTVKVHPRHSQNRIFDAFRCFAAHFCSWNGAPFVHFWKQICARTKICFQKRMSEL